MPSYSWFRIYAHGKTVRQLARNAGRPDQIIPILPVLLFIFAHAAYGAGDFLPGSSETDYATLGQALSSLLLILIAIGLTAFLVSHIQGSLNRYWQHREPPGRRPRRGLKPGAGGGLALGLLLWLDMILTIGGAIAG